MQSRWQGPFTVVKCVQGNTYRIKQANNFRKRFLRHRDQLRVLRARPERLRPTQGENGSGHTVIVPPVLAMSSQPEVRLTGTSSHPQNSRAQDQPTGASLPPSTDVASTTPAVHAKNLPRTAEPPCGGEQIGSRKFRQEPCSAPSLEIRRRTRSRRPPDRYGEWDLNPSDDANIDIYFIH